MLSKVQMWGNSLAIRIPKNIARDINFDHGTQVEFSQNGKSLILTPKEKKEYTLKELLRGVKKENLHGEISTGPTIGKEIIE